MEPAARGPSPHKTARSNKREMAKETTPLVAVIMGSKSDWSTMQHAHEMLDRFGVPHECKVMSAHRTPDLTTEYASAAESRGMQVMIAAAGGAAHLAGVIAAHNPSPGAGRADRKPCPQGDGFAIGDRPNARGNPRRHSSHRQARCGERGAAGRPHPLEQRSRAAREAPCLPGRASREGPAGNARLADSEPRAKATGPPVPVNRAPRLIRAAGPSLSVAYAHARAGNIRKLLDQFRARTDQTGPISASSRNVSFSTRSAWQVHALNATRRQAASLRSAGLGETCGRSPQFARLWSRVHETTSVSMASSCIERKASESRRSLRALRYATSMRRPPDGGRDSSPRCSEAEPWVKPTTSWRAPDGAQERSVVLSNSDPELREKLRAFRAEQAEKVRQATLD